MKHSDRDVNWWLGYAVHNCVAHPLLLVAMVLVTCSLSSWARPLFWLHDVTSPEGDPYNMQKFNG